MVGDRNEFGVEPSFAVTLASAPLRRSPALSGRVSIRVYVPLSPHMCHATPGIGRHIASTGNVKADGQRAGQRALPSAEASELLAFLSLSACAVRAAILAKASEYLYSRPHSSDDERKRIGLAKV